MTDQPDGESAVTEKRTNWTMRILFAMLAVAVVAAIVFSLFQMNTGDDSAGENAETTGTTSEPTTSPSAPDPTETEGDDDVEPSQTPGLTPVLDAPQGGQEAIDALGDDIQIVADRNNMTVDEVKELLLRDKNAKVSPNGFIFFSGG